MWLLSHRRIIFSMTSPTSHSSWIGCGCAGSFLRRIECNRILQHNPSHPPASLSSRRWIDRGLTCCCCLLWWSVLFHTMLFFLGRTWPLVSTTFSVCRMFLSLSVCHRISFCGGRQHEHQLIILVVTLHLCLWATQGRGPHTVTNPCFSIPRKEWWL